MNIADMKAMLAEAGVTVEVLSAEDLARDLAGGVESECDYSEECPATMHDNAVEAARVRRQACHRAVSSAVDRGDMAAAERHTAAYLAAAAEEDRLEAEALAQNPYRPTDV